MNLARCKVVRQNNIFLLSPFEIEFIEFLRFLSWRDENGWSREHHRYLGHNGVCLLDILRNSCVVGVKCFFSCNRQESVSKGFQKNKKIKTENNFYIVFLRKTGQI